MPECGDSRRSIPCGRVLAIAVAAILAALLTAACGPSGEKDRLAGTWKPEEGQNTTYSYEFKSGGLVYAYREGRGDKPELEGRYTIQSQWREGGADWYRLLNKWGAPGWFERGAPHLREAYSLVRIDKNGKRMTHQWNLSAFPEKLDTANVHYATFIRE